MSRCPQLASVQASAWTLAALALVLGASCGATVAPRADGGDPSVPTESIAAAATTGAPSPATIGLSTTTAPIPDASAATDPPIDPIGPAAALDDEVLVAAGATLGRLGSNGAVRYLASPGVLSPDGRTVATTTVSASTGDGDRTTLRLLDGGTGATRATGTLPGALVPSLVGPQYVVLVAAADVQAVTAPGTVAPGRSTTRLVLADATTGALAHEWNLPGNFVPEAFSPVLGAVVVIEYLPAMAPTSYRVRTVDARIGGISLPAAWQDKSPTVDEVMTASGRTHVLSPSGEVLYTLYRSTADSVDPGHAFIHTLGLDFARVFCLDLPDEIGFADHAGAVGVAPDGTVVYAVNSAGRLVEVVSHGETLGSGGPPAVGRVVSIGMGSDGAPAIAVDPKRVWVALGHDVVEVDRTTLAVVSRVSLPFAASALAAGPGGATGGPLAAGDGRLARLSGAGGWQPIGDLPTRLGAPTWLALP